tara:strand:- start:359 stop:1636 length:1278 start_codon:yes stop_codon:yes gene_type:complete
MFFDYDDRHVAIKSHLEKNYSFEIIKTGSIKFYPFPLAKLELNDVVTRFNSSEVDLVTKKLIIYPKLITLYNFKNFDSKKIKLIKNSFSTDFFRLKDLYKYFLNVEKKIQIRNLNLLIRNSDNTLFKLNNVSFSNYGYKQNTIEGEVFGKEFKINLKNNPKKIDFKLLETGISIFLNFSDYNRNKTIGNIKGKILKAKIKSDFIYNQELIRVKKFYFREKNLSFNSEGVILLKPFLEINLKTQIVHLNNKLLKNINLESVLNFKDIIKKINSNIDFTFKRKKFSRSVIDNLNMKINLAYGRLNIQKIFVISESQLKCKSETNLLEEYPVVIFDCSLSSQDKKKLLKNFDIKYKSKNEPLNLDVKGNLNILNNKINFELIKINKDYTATKEDLNFFKNSFENILFDQNFVNIFDLLKIKSFIDEVS